MAYANLLSDRRHLPLLALIAGGIAIGGSPIFVRLSELGPVATAFWRLALGLLPLCAFALIWRPEALRLPERRSDYALLMLPGIFLAADLVAWHLAIHWTSIANATLLVNLSPVFVTLGSWLLFGAKVSRGFIAGLVIALVGVVVLKAGDGGGLSGGHWVGDLSAVIGAVFYAGYMLALGSARGRFDTMRVMLWNTATAALSILPVALVMESAILPSTLRGWEILLALALISHVGGQALIIYALAFLPMSFSSLTLLLQPVVASLLGIVVLGELLGPLGWAGGGIVLTGILIARRSRAS